MWSSEMNLGSLKAGRIQRRLGCWLVLLCLGCLERYQVMAQVNDAVAETRPVTSSVPLITIKEFLEGARSWGEERVVRVRGVVTHSISDKTFFIQDGDAGTYVFHKPSPAFKPGELVEVIGRPSLGAFSPTLHYCETRLLGTGEQPRAITATAAEVLTGAFNMRLITVSGYLAPERLRGGRVLVLNPGRGGQAFTADLESQTELEAYDQILPGSRLEITGVCSVKRDVQGKVASFNVFVRSPEDVRVISLPSWWTLKRTLVALGIAAGCLLIAVTWVVTLRREVRNQTARMRRLNAELEQRVRERTLQLTEANRELEAFNYSVSHDLRTPLRHIDGFVMLAREEPDLARSATLQKCLQQIADASDRMGRLIDSLLGLSKMARQPLIRQPLDMNRIVADAIQSLEPDAVGRQIEWNIGSLPKIHGDPDMLRLAWINLISNALKYTRNKPKAIVEIDARREGARWIFSIRDNGAGFNSGLAQRLFEVFQRFHRDDEFEGTGVGLANVRRIILRHGGEIWAESKRGEGATFYFTLPVEASDGDDADSAKA
jgi:signal transduction histidine kinase